MSSTSTLRSVTCLAPVSVALHLLTPCCCQPAWPCTQHALRASPSCRFEEHGSQKPDYQPDYN